MIRAFGLAVLIALAGLVSSARGADVEQCEAAAQLLKGVYAKPQSPKTAVENAKLASDVCLDTLAARVKDCRERFPGRDQECRQHVARQDACTKVLDAYALAIKKQDRSIDLGSSANEDPREDFDRGKSHEDVCFRGEAPSA